MKQQKHVMGQYGFKLNSIRENCGWNCRRQYSEILRINGQCRSMDYDGTGYKFYLTGISENLGIMRRWKSSNPRDSSMTLSGPGPSFTRRLSPKYGWAIFPNRLVLQITGYFALISAVTPSHSSTILNNRHPGQDSAHSVCSSKFVRPCEVSICDKTEHSTMLGAGRNYGGLECGKDGLVWCVRPGWGLVSMI